MAIIDATYIETILGMSTPFADEEAAQIAALIDVAESSVFTYLQRELGNQKIVEFLPMMDTNNDRDRGPLNTARLTPEAHVYEINTTARFALQLRVTPVISTGLELKVDEAGNAGQKSGAFSDPALTLGEDYWLDADRPADYDDPDGVFISQTGVLWKSTEWPTTPRSVRVTYFGGMSATVMSQHFSVLQYATHLVVMNLKNMSAGLRSTVAGGNGPLQSESLGKYSYTTSASFLQNLGGTGGHITPAIAHMLQPFRNYGNLFAG